MLKRNIFIGAIWLVVLLLWALPVLAEMIVDTAWVRKYSGPAYYHDDAARAIALDDYGNIYVTGSSRGNGSYYDLATIKYYPNGDTAWVRRYNAPEDSADQAVDIAVDSEGNVYVTGTSWGGNSTRDDFVTIKYYSDGDTAWVRRYDGPGHSNDWVLSIAVDVFGSIYVTGASVGDGTHGDYATLKYDPSGDTLWVRRYNGSGDSTDMSVAVAVDLSGNVFVTGHSWGSGTSHDIATIKYLPDGGTAWVVRYNGPGNYLDLASDLAVDDSGNVYVSGSSRGMEASSDYLTIKYYPNGDTAWIRYYDGPNNGGDKTTAIAVDGSGNVYVTGESGGVGTSSDYATIKYYPNGDTAWVRRYDNPWHAQDRANDIAVDDSGNVYVTGQSWAGSLVGDVYATLKYLPDGDTAWVRRFDVMPLNSDQAYALAVDASGNIYVTGETGGSYRDYATIKYFQALRGDADGDRVVDVDDLVYSIYYLYLNGPPPDPFATGDVDCTGEIDLGDVLFLINYLYKGGPAPDC